VIVERVGKVTIYQRGGSYSLYYRHGGITHRKKIDGNLSVAKATANKILTSIDEVKPSPIAFTRTSPADMVTGYLAAVTNVQKLALRTQDRYRAALQRFLDFCTSEKITGIEVINETTVEQFVGWLRGLVRVRNGAPRGRKESYKLGGVKFILSTCRTCFNWASRRQMLPPFTENPFATFGLDKLRDRESTDSAKIFTVEQEQAFFAACDDWQIPIFRILACYGLRVGELTHLLIDDINWTSGEFFIRSKHWLFWNVKTGTERRLPLLPTTRDLFAKAIGDRKAGFVFRLRSIVSQPASKGIDDWSTPAAFQSAVARRTADIGGERDQKRAANVFGRTQGQIPEKKVREEFMSVTRRIGLPHFTRVHDLRHLFSTRAQAAGINPILVQGMLGHTTLEMTKRYTHLNMANMRDALSQLADPVTPSAQELQDC